MPDSGTKFSFVAAGIYTACRALKKGMDNEFDTEDRGKTRRNWMKRTGYLGVDMLEKLILKKSASDLEKLGAANVFLDIWIN